MIKLGIVGALGRMGRTIASLAVPESNWNFVCAMESASHSASGKKYSELTQILHAQIPVSSWAKPLTAENTPEVIIDFSLPESTVETAAQCQKLNIPLVIGTTGWNDEQYRKVVSASETIPMLISSNMSVGVNLLFKLAQVAATSLKDYPFDIEVMEVHHRHKKDAPSGTSRTIEKVLLEATGRNSENLVHGREGITGERPDLQIGSMALRGGDVVGEHTVYFFGEGERIEIKHTATSRNIFASGALNAAAWLVKQKAGLYSMKDVLGL